MDKLLKLSFDTDIKSTDAKDFFLASKLSSQRDYFNSLSLLFKIVGNKNLIQLNLIQSYSVLTIIKNLGFEDQFKEIANKMLL